MRAYWYDNLPGDQRLPHDSSHPVSAADLARLGVHYQPIASADAVDALAAARGYRNRDEITVSRSALGEAYEAKVASFFREHLHEDEEIRYVVGGAGYFDVRGEGDAWVRVRVERGDLLVLPAGIYHRFTTDEGDYIKAMRLFKDEPKWTPLDRGPQTDANPYRAEYLKTVEGAVETK